MNFKSIKSSKNLQNSIWNIVEVLLSPLILFISIPIFLSKLGAQEYGIWMFVNSVIVMMQAINLGLNYSTYKHISASIPSNDESQISNTLNTNLSLSAILFFVSLLLITVISGLIEYENMFVKDLLHVKGRLISCLFIGSIIVFTKLAEQILYNVYRAYENFKYVTILTVVIKMVTVIGNIFIAIFTQNIIYILLFTTLTAMIGLFINYSLLPRFIPNYKFKFTLSKKLINYEIKYSKYIWLQSIVVIVVYQGDRLLVSEKFGVVLLSYYAIVATLFNHIHMAFGAITAWLFPQVAKNKNDKEFVFQLYLTSRNISIALSVILLGIFSIVSKPLFTLWLGESNYYEIADYLKWFTIFEFFFIFTIVPNYFLNASDNEKFSLKMVSVFGGLNIIGLCIGLYVFHSPVSMLIGLAITTVIGMFYLHYSVNSKFSPSKNTNIFQLILLFIPSFFGSGTAYFEEYLFKICSFILCLISIYLIYIKQRKTNFKLLIQ